MRAQSDKQSEAVHNNINNNIIEIFVIGYFEFLGGGSWKRSI